MKKNKFFFYSIKNVRIIVSKVFVALLLMFYTTAAFPQFWTSHFGDNASNKTVDLMARDGCADFYFFGEAIDINTNISDIYTASFNLDGEQTGSRIYEVYDQASQTHLSVEFKDVLNIPRRDSMPIMNWENGGKIILGKVISGGSYYGNPIILSYNSNGLEAAKIIYSSSVVNFDLLSLSHGIDPHIYFYVGGSIDKYSTTSVLNKLPFRFVSDINLSFFGSSEYFDFYPNGIFAEGYIDEIMYEKDTSLLSDYPFQALIPLKDLTYGNYYLAFFQWYLINQSFSYIDFNNLESTVGNITSLELVKHERKSYFEFKLLLNLTTDYYSDIALILDVNFSPSPSISNEVFYFLNPGFKAKDFVSRNANEIYMTVSFIDGQDKAGLIKLDGTHFIQDLAALSVSSGYVSEELLLVNSISRAANGIITAGVSQDNGFFQDVTVIKSYFNFETPCNLEQFDVQNMEVDLNIEESNYEPFQINLFDDLLEVHQLQSDYSQSCYVECMPNGSNLRPAKTGTKKMSKFSETEFFSIVPNPTQGKLSLNNKKKEFVKTIEVRSLNGRVLKTYNVESKFENYQIDLSDLPKSMYIIHVITNKTSYSYKAIHN